MPYTDESFERMKTDAHLNRQFFWSAFMRWKRDYGESCFIEQCFAWLNSVSDEDLLKLVNTEEE